MSLSASVATIVVDDTDPAIEYSGVWFTGGGSVGEFNHTTHGTRSPGASFRFTFNGTFVSVLGTISPAGFFDSPPPQSTYMLDDSSPSIFSPTPDSSTHTGVTFYTSPKLRDDQHTLVVTCIVNNTFFWVDSLLVTPSAPSASVSADTQLPSSSQPAITYSPRQGTLLPSSPSKTTLPIGAVVGGLLGGLIFLLSVVLFLLCRWRRRAAAQSRRPEPFISGSPRIIHPSRTKGSNLSRIHFPSGRFPSSQTSANPPQTSLVSPTSSAVGGSSTLTGSEAESSVLNLFTYGRRPPPPYAQRTSPPTRPEIV